MERGSARLNSAGQCVMTAGQCVMTAGQSVKTAGQCVMTAGQCVMTAGQCVMTAWGPSHTNMALRMDDAKIKRTWQSV